VSAANIRDGRVRVLLVEDHRAMREMVSDHLTERGYAVDAVMRGNDALAAVASNGYDAVILDLGLPDMDGIEVMRALGRAADAPPALIITARATVDDRVNGLDAGADDYIPKPFALVELEARLRAILRRPGTRRSTVLECGDLAFDSVARDAAVAGQSLNLTRREASVLEELIVATGRVVVRDFLEERLYAAGREVSPNALEATVSRLRKKLQAACTDATIETVRGIGYRMRSGSSA
jgi:two-component system, OmpR family, response regulator QseB